MTSVIGDRHGLTEKRAGIFTSRWSTKAAALISSQENILWDSSYSEGINSAFYLQISKFLT